MVKSVPHMELPRDVGRRHYDGIRLLVPVALCYERAGLLPGLVYPFLEILRVIILGKVLFHDKLILSMFVYRMSGRRFCKKRHGYTYNIITQNSLYNKIYSN